MKKLFVIFTFFVQAMVGQPDTIVKFEQKFYRVFVSLADARKANPDSVFGLFLCCENLSEFPTEIFKYKNLKYLDFGNENWDNPIVYRKLSKMQKRKYHKKVQERKSYHEIVMPDYPHNKIKTIPDEITQLKNLEVLSLGDLGYDDFTVADLIKLEKLLPTTTIDPPSKAIQLQKKWDEEDKNNRK